jgi:hypothetical protein
LKHRKSASLVRAGAPESAQAAWQNSRLFEIARVFVRLDHVARFIVNANHMVKSQVTGQWSDTSDGMIRAGREAAFTLNK